MYIYYMQNYLNYLKEVTLEVLLTIFYTGLLRIRSELTGLSAAQEESLCLLP